MNRQRKVLITTTYNELGIIIDTKAEEVAQPDLQPTCNQLATDCISRQQAIDAINALHEKPNAWLDSAVDAVMTLPSAQPHWIPCSERLPEVKPFRTEDADYEISEAVLVTRDSWQDTKIEISFWEVDDTDRKYWVDEYGAVLCGVVAWMPLPKPYGGESE